MSSSGPTTAAGGPSMSAMGTPSPLPPSSSSMATPSTGPRLSTRKRNSSSSSAGRTTLIETAEMTTTPARRTSRDLSSSSFKENDPSAVVMMSGTMELATEENVSDHRQVSEHGSLLRSSAKTMNGKAVENPNVSGTKPKALKLSLQATPSTKNRSNTVSRPRLVKDIFSRSSLLFLSFILIAGLVTTFYGSTTHPPSFEGMSMEGQVAELEEILRKTTKMMQVQLDLVDMKIHKEVDGLRKELEDKIDEQTISFGTELKNMKARTEDIEASLKTFIDAGFPTRHDVLNLITSIVEQRASEGTGDALSLDDVRAVARRIVEAELDKHAADGIGRVDYALTSGGGKVIDHSEGFYHGLKFGWQQLVGSFLPGGNHKHSLANKILEPSFGEPGQCLPLKGNNVYVDIALRTSVFPDAFSLEHVSKSVAYDVSSAPKDFRVFGWLDSFKKDDTTEKSVSQLLLGEFRYDIEKKNVQTFTIPEGSKARGKLINMVKLEVFSNYGSLSHTCIYRFRVHGSDLKSIQASTVPGV